MNRLLAELGRRDRNSVVIETGAEGQSVSAGELLVAVGAQAADLRAAGIDRLGLLAENSPAWLTVDLACQMADVCLLPLPPFFANGQLRSSLASAGVTSILTDDADRVAALFTGAPVAVTPDWLPGLTLLRFAEAERPALPPGTRKITFTSGSTGNPRGVCLAVEQQLRVAEALHTALQLKAPRHLCLLPLSTLLENIGGVYYPLLAGGSVTVISPGATGFSGSGGLDMPPMLEAISRHRPTSIILIPQMLVGLVAALEAGWKPPAELQFAAVGGARVAPGMLVRARELGLPVYEGYGLSETASVACLNRPGADRVGSAGQPLGHIRLAMHEGEVHIRDNVFLGYVGQPDSWGSPVVATGDLGSLDADGYLYLNGRRKNLLITSYGRNISPEWIESELLRFPQLAQVVVAGDSRPYCVALITAAASTVTDSVIQECVDAVNAGLPDYARVQRWMRLTQPLTEAEGMYTANGRPCRDLITARFTDAIDSLYADTARLSA